MASVTGLNEELLAVLGLRKFEEEYALDIRSETTFCDELIGTHRREVVDI